MRPITTTHAMSVSNYRLCQSSTLRPIIEEGKGQGESFACTEHEPHDDTGGTGSMRSFVVDQCAEDTKSVTSKKSKNIAAFLMGSGMNSMKYQPTSAQVTMGGKSNSKITQSG